MRNFLSPILADGNASFSLASERTGATLASELEAALDSASRKRGLLRRDGLAPDAAIVLAPCPAIHTAFMRFSIDVVFTAKDGTVLKICPTVKPWRAAASLRAFAAIEFAAGRSAAVDIRVGDRLLLSRRD